MKSNIKNKNGGFIQFVIVVIIAILLMKYFDITLADVFNWFVAQLRGVF